MSTPAEGLSVALVHSGGGPSERAARGLHGALRDAGHDSKLIGGAGPSVPERLLAWRGFTPCLSALPRLLRALGTDDFEMVHAFDVVAATAALVWGRRSGAPVVCTFVEALDRGTVADRRLRLRLLTAALEESDAVLAANAAARAGLLRWAAVDSPVVQPADATGHERLYRELLNRRMRA